LWDDVQVIFVSTLTYPASDGHAASVHNSLT